jgi:hypothetical protein
MVLGYEPATLRAGRMDQITSLAGGSATINIYAGTRPATGGSTAATTLLATLTCGSTAIAPPSTNGVLTFNAITSTTDAAATGTATWFRIKTSTGGHVMDGGVGSTSSTEDLQLDNTSIVQHGTVAISSFVITEGNA